MDCTGGLTFKSTCQMHLSDCRRLVGLRLNYAVNNRAMMDEGHSRNVNIVLHYKNNNVHISKYILVQVLLHESVSSTNARSLDF